LVQWGYKVLCVDWDIEAPGLNFYFPVQRRPQGLYQLISSVKSGKIDSWEECVQSVAIPRSEFSIDVIYASSRDATDEERPIDWDHLYKDESLGSALEDLRELWKAKYDFVFIDSRTGVTDAGAVCTVHLPDMLVFLLTANDQSLDGSVQIVNKAISARQRLPVERSGLRTMPLVSRFDSREEYDQARAWRTKLSRSLAAFYSSWTPNEQVAGDILNLTTIPYIARWSFGEEIIGAREPDSPELISYYFYNIAAIIAQRCYRVEDFLDGRESYIRSAQRRATLGGGFTYDAYLNNARTSEAVARSLVRILNESGLRIYHRDENPSANQFVANVRREILLSARDLVVVVDQYFSKQQHDYVTLFLRELANADFDRRVIPVWTIPPNSSSVPRIMQQFSGVTTYDKSFEHAVKQLTNLLGRKSRE
jgi:hypothetical protein